MNQVFTKNLEILKTSLQSSASLFREHQISYDDRSLLDYNYKVQDLVWVHVFSQVFIAEYTRGNVSVTLEYSENNPYEIAVKISGRLGDGVDLRITKSAEPLSIIDLGIFQYVLNLLVDAKSDLEESI